MNKMKIAETAFVISIFVSMAFIIVVSNPELTGNVIRSTPDYQKYKEKMDDETFETLSTSYYYEKKEYIITLQNYEEDVEEILEELPDHEVKELAFIDAVAVDARKQDMIDILEKDVVEKVYLDKKVEVLRDSALETLNITNLRTYGPSEWNATGSGLKIGIIDTGVDYTHSEFNCVPGASGCFIKRSVSAMGSTNETVNRNRVETRFTDLAERKLLDLSTGSKKVEFRIRKNHTINSATLDVNATGLNINLNSIYVTSQSTLDLSQAISNSLCYERDGFCYYNITFTGSGHILLEDLSIDYSFSHYEGAESGTDEHGHGTFITGIYHQAVPDAEIYMYKVIGASGGGAVSDTIAGIEMAYYDNVDVMSMSIGIQRIGRDCGEPLLEAALQKAYGAGILLVASAGNDPSHQPYEPSCFENTVAISSIDDDKTLSSFSTYGPEIEYAMTGSFITSPTLYGQYFTGNGTSYAAPFAVAEYTMVYEYFKEKTGRYPLPFQARNISGEYAEDLGSSGRDNYFGYGMMQINKMMYAIASSTLLFTNVERVNISSSMNYQSIELYTNNNDTVVPLTLECDDITIQSSTVPVRINGHTSSFDINLANKTVLFIEADISNLSSSSLPGTYNTTLTLTSSDPAASLDIPISFRNINTINASDLNYTYSLGTFSFDDMVYSYMEIITWAVFQIFHTVFDVIDPGYSEYNYSNLTLPESFAAFNVSNETIDYFLFWVENETILDQFNWTYEEDTDFNYAYYLSPVFKINRSSNETLRKFYITVTAPNGTTTLYNTSPVAFTLDPEYAANTSNVYYTFTEDGMYPTLELAALGTLSTLGDGSDKTSDYKDKIQRFIEEKGIHNIDNSKTIILEMFNELYDTNFYPMLANGQYTLELYTELDSTPIKLDTKTITVNNNLTVLLRDGFLFIDEIQPIIFDVKDNRRIINKFLGNRVYNTTIVYGNPDISVYLNDTRLNPTIGLENMTVVLPSSSYSEGLNYLDINYALYGNNGSSHDPVTVLHAVKLNISQVENNLSPENNLTIKLNFSKKGTLAPSAAVSLALDSNCDDYASLNQTSFTISSISSSTGTVMRDVLVYLPDNNSKAKSCDLIVTFNVSGVCLHCSSSSVPYTEVHKHNFSMLGPSANISMDVDVDDSAIRIGEYFNISVNITNNDNSTFYGALSIRNYTGLVTVGVNSYQFILTPGYSLEKTFTFYSSSEATLTPSFELSGDGVSSVVNQTISISGAMFTNSVSKSKSTIYQDDPFYITVSITNSNNQAIRPVITLDSATSSYFSVNSPSTSSISAGSTGDRKYTVSALSPGTSYFSGRITYHNSSETFNYSVSVNQGTAYSITLDDEYDKYEIGVNDTLFFETNIGCEDNYDACNDTCKDAEKYCDDGCKSIFQEHRDQRNTCKQECEKESDSDDRKDCRDECEIEYDDHKDNKDRCLDDCEDDADDCYDDCENDYEECEDDKVEVEIKLDVDEFEEDQLDFDIESDETSYSFTLYKGDTKKLDMDDDGYYETQIQLYDLIEDDNYTCEDDCDDSLEDAKDSCDSVYDECKDECDDSDCRQDCRDDRYDCKEDAADYHDDCVDECELRYSHYELKIMYITPEEIPYDAPACSNTAISACTTETKCEMAGGYWYEEECNALPQFSCSSTHVDKCTTQESCEEQNGYWYAEACHAEPESATECSSENLEYCMEMLTCESAEGYWYTGKCNEEPESICKSENLEECRDAVLCEDVGGYWYSSRCNLEPMSTEECSSTNPYLCTDESDCTGAGGYWYESQCNSEPETAAELQCSPDNLELCDSQPRCENANGYWDGEICISAAGPSEEKPSSILKYIIIALVLIIISGLSVGAYVYMKNSADGSAGSEHKDDVKDKKQRLAEYFMKQLERGNDLTYILFSLKKLGWDPNLVDEVAKSLRRDPDAQAIVKITRFALSYGVNDPNEIKRKFRGIDPSVINKALMEIDKRKRER